jgi:predicted enzyme related to lactoylglutathione lyase
MKAKLVFVTLPAADPKKTADFYAKHIGIEFGRTFSDSVVSYHAPVLEDGTQLSVQERLSAQDVPTCYLAVDDIASTIPEMLADGARLIFGPVSMPVAKDALGGFVANGAAFFDLEPQQIKDDLGLVALLLDPAGNRLGLIQFEEFMHPMYSLGKFAKDLSSLQRNSHRVSVEMGKLFDRIPRPVASPESTLSTNGRGESKYHD